MGNHASRDIGGSAPEMTKLSQRLLAKSGKTIDFSIFSRCIIGKYATIPHALTELLWFAFSTDLTSKLEVSDFLSTLAVIHGTDRTSIMRLLFRVYDVKQAGYLERSHIEKVLSTVYGLPDDTSKEHANRTKALLEGLFASSSVTDKRFLARSDLEAYAGPLDIFSSWVQTVLGVFTEPPTPKLLALERRYASALESEEMMARFNVERSTCDQLRQLFHSKCLSAVKAELPFDTWIDWCSSGGYTSPALASVLFRTKVGTYKNVWRFADFAEFCMVYGAGSNETKADAISGAFLSEFFASQAQGLDAIGIPPENGARPLTPGLSSPTRHTEPLLPLQAFQRQMRRMFYLLVQTYVPSSSSTKAFSANASPSREAPTSRQGREVKPRSISLSSSRAELVSHDGTIMPLSVATGAVATAPSPLDYYVPLEELQATMIPLPESIQEALSSIEQDHSLLNQQECSYVQLLAPYSKLITTHAENLPALRELAMTACCLFGIRPPSPSLEKAYIMGIMLRRQEEAPQSRADPYGPLNTEWCVVSKAWWDSWRLYVGQQRPKLRTPRKSNTNGGAAFDEPSAPVPPPAIDNWVILKKSGAKQLLQGTIVGHHLEVIPPQIYSAVHSWYGGGPRVMRRVISTPSGGTELELFPISLKICTCDNAGKAKPVERELLFSKTSTLSDVADELCSFFGVERSRIRLWNMAMTSWQKQYILSPELTLLSAGLQDGQTVLMELSLPSGVWPRSQLHARLESELDASSKDEAKEGERGEKRIGRKAPLNAGTVGLDNLGNTCYLNASLQVLMHTEPLMEYFLSQSHLKHINDSNKFGQGGKLALSFGRLANELWSTDKNSLSPKAFYAELTACRDQFAGHQQHDAHEFLEVLLDRLSEDLNLVDDKPFIEQPDSDGRPDSVLADIWWSNHFKRDSSIVQSLFAGQFKTVTTCTGCGYSSDRYEVFTSLSLSIPEETQRVLCVHVLTRHVPFSIQVHVTVRRDGDLASVVAALLSSSLDPPLEGLRPPGVSADINSQPPIFIGAEVVQSRVIGLCSMARRINTIKDTDFLFLFQVAATENASQEMEGEEEESEESEEDPEEATESPSGPRPSLMTRRRKFLVFIQRKVQLHSSGAVDFFRMEPFGLPFVEEISQQRSALSGRQLYEMVHERVRIFFKNPKASAPGPNSGLGSSPARSPAKSEIPQSKFDSHKLSPFPPITHSETHPLGPVSASKITSAPSQDLSSTLTSTDDLVGGAVPEFGFVLRRVMGGSQGGVMCSRCPWLARCQGCVIPLDAPGDVEADQFNAIDLAEGECIAIDWHRIVFEELLDTAAAIEMRKHVPKNGTGGGGSSGSRPTETRLPLSSCLDRFTEEDAIQGFVCSKCKSDDLMKRSFKLWRAPPVLVVQLKRFRFDRSSRRKLNTRVDIPLTGLDLTKYCAEQSRGITPVPLYDLTGAIHHVGALGGGHYLTAIRNKEGQWILMNDGLVSKLESEDEVSAASAYLLVFKRRDVVQGLDLFPAGLSVDRSKQTMTKIPASTTLRQKARQFVGRSKTIKVVGEEEVPEGKTDEDAPTQASPQCALA